MPLPPNRVLFAPGLWLVVLVLLGGTISVPILATVFLPTYSPPLQLWAVIAGFFSVLVFAAWLEVGSRVIDQGKAHTPCERLSPAAKQELVRLLVDSPLGATPGGREILLADLPVAIRAWLGTTNAPGEDVHHIVYRLCEWGDTTTFKVFLDSATAALTGMQAGTALARWRKLYTME